MDFVRFAALCVTLLPVQVLLRHQTRVRGHGDRPQPGGADRVADAIK